MHSSAMYEELARGIDIMISDPKANLASIDREMAELMSLAADLRQMPSPVFRAELRTALVGEMLQSNTPIAPPLSSRRTDEHVLFGSYNSTYPMQRSNFLASALIHTAAIALLTISGLWLAKHTEMAKRGLRLHLSNLMQVSSLPYPRRP